MFLCFPLTFQDRVGYNLSPWEMGCILNTDTGFRVKTDVGAGCVAVSVEHPRVQTARGHPCSRCVWDKGSLCTVPPVQSHRFPCTWQTLRPEPAENWKTESHLNKMSTNGSFYVQGQEGCCTERHQWGGAEGNLDRNRNIPARDEHIQIELWTSR